MKTFVTRVLVLAMLGLLVGGVASCFPSKPIDLREPNVRAASDDELATRPPDGNAAGNSTGSSAAQTPPAHPAGDHADAPAPYKSVTVAQARRMYESRHEYPGTIFVDARREDLYIAGHVDGAMHLPPTAFRDGVPQDRVDALMFKRVVIYCGGADCHDSHEVAEQLANLLDLSEEGIGIFIMVDGYPAWQKESLPIATGRDELYGG